MIDPIMLSAQYPWEACGFIPSFLDADDPRPAQEQLDAKYGHGGGFMPFQGFTLGDKMALIYPGDPDQLPNAVIKLRRELIFIYPFAWVLILQPDGKWVVARMD